MRNEIVMMQNLRPSPLHTFVQSVYCNINLDITNDTNSINDIQLMVVLFLIIFNLLVVTYESILCYSW